MNLLLLTIAMLIPSSHEDKLKVILDNIKSNEKMYADNIDARWKSNYGIVDVNKTFPRTQEQVMKEIVEARCVIQNGKVKLWANKNYESGKDIKTDLELLSLYDGKVSTRKQNKIVNVNDGKEIDSGLIYRPHTLLIRRHAVDVPLSVYVQGGAAFRTHPDAGVFNTNEMRAFYEETEKLDGDECERVRVEYRKEKTPEKVTAYTKIWLSTGHNYIPIKMESYYINVSEKLPGFVGKVTEWKEVTTGMWVPWKWTYTTYVTRELRKGKQDVLFHEEGKMSDFSINPTHADEFFQDIEAKHNTVVYTVNEGGKIVKSEVIKKHSEVNALYENSYSRLAYIIVGIVIVIIGLCIVYNKARA